MFRSDHEEMVAELRSQIAELKQQLHPVADPPAVMPEAKPRSDFDVKREAVKTSLRSLYLRSVNPP